MVTPPRRRRLHCYTTAVADASRTSRPKETYYIHTLYVSKRRHNQPPGQSEPQRNGIRRPAMAPKEDKRLEIHTYIVGYFPRRTATASKSPVFGDTRGTWYPAIASRGTAQHCLDMHQEDSKTTTWVHILICLSGGACGALAAAAADDETTTTKQTNGTRPC